mgnify:CR=1 FL=1
MAKHPKEEKTNVVRILEAAGIPCTAYEVPLPKGEVPDGVTAAKLLGKPPEQVFKTLVAQGPKGEHFVFVIPVAETLDLKKAAKAAGAHFVKTSTGFSTGGATTHDIALMRKTVGPEMGVKASGGIRDYETAMAMIEAGANRIGASAGIAIVAAAE